MPNLKDTPTQETALAERSGQHPSTDKGAAQDLDLRTLALGTDRMTVELAQPPSHTKSSISQRWGKGLQFAGTGTTIEVSVREVPR